ncbi:protein of unknown function [Candidatus Nitrosocosmicus franklandus]|uniref:Uncharacterized protein n=1 Tax=Candidatus Nitrosocosmicus franklandianus TaxID=1798806 RepID=A0A484IHC3_9ARCH|nr:protein of unknown function [Candidatus Nitrosocosmicus franklandus]
MLYCFSAIYADQRTQSTESFSNILIFKANMQSTKINPTLLHKGPVVIKEKGSIWKMAYI